MERETVHERRILADAKVERISGVLPITIVQTGTSADLRDDLRRPDSVVGYILSYG
jgi:hypothetical protein